MQLSVISIFSRLRSCKQFCDESKKNLDFKWQVDDASLLSLSHNETEILHFVSINCVVMNTSDNRFIGLDEIAGKIVISNEFSSPCHSAQFPVKLQMMQCGTR